MEQNYTSAVFTDVAFLNETHGWVVGQWTSASSGNGIVMYTSDGGVTWTTQEAAAIGTDDYNAVWFSDSDHGYAVADSGVVVKTDDGGTTWGAVTAITGTPNVLSVYVFDEDNVIVGDNGGDRNIGMGLNLCVQTRFLAHHAILVEKNL